MTGLLLLGQCRIALGERRGIERLVSLLLATIDGDAGARVDDFIAENENGVFLGRGVGVYPKTSKPSRSAKMVNRPHPGDFEHPKRCIRKNASDVIRDNLPIVRLGKIRLERRIGQVLDDAARGASRQTYTKREDAKTHSRSTC